MKLLLSYESTNSPVESRPYLSSPLISHDSVSHPVSPSRLSQVSNPQLSHNSHESATPPVSLHLIHLHETNRCNPQSSHTFTSPSIIQILEWSPPYDHSTPI
ncbi:hypothetical protein AMTR_s00034p00094530 [Amborella trichopoda]|uniref:Uncharacterized protein n=1 Tax=Amborella trichopoda TaxID=13333 RepID=W1PXM8_AMBTC|nr:hypothetical protein AMTR_s00034p00094530 [Amborella trichopoda]